MNSTPEELTAFVDGYLERAGAPNGEHGRISKISVQTGTSHGGTPLPDGTVAAVNLDFNVLRDLSRLSRQRYGLAGAVQHGASTLPEEAFDRFPKAETAEIHLATGFQNMLLDHPRFPADLRREIGGWVSRECAGERKAGWTDEQFLYKSRKKAYGPFKREMWSLPPETLEALGTAFESKFAFYFRKLGVAETRDLVRAKIRRHLVRAPRPAGALRGAEQHAEKDLPASELAD